MSKNKLKKFEETRHFERVFQPDFNEVFQKDYFLKGKWNKQVFQNKNPLVLELGCGKGEYTIGLASEYKEKNFIGVDIKGARIWKGAKESNEKSILNSGFLRTRIEFINSFFAKDEVEEIWLTFPDPQAKKRRMKKRLSGPRFLNLYQQFLINNGIIHLKTDSRVLYDYTLKLVQHNNLEILFQTDNLYSSGMEDKILGIKTFYERQYLEQGINIHYLKFRLPAEKEITDLPDEE